MPFCPVAQHRDNYTLPCAVSISTTYLCSAFQDNTYHLKHHPCRTYVQNSHLFPQQINPPHLYIHIIVIDTAVVRLVFVFCDPHQVDGSWLGNRSEEARYGRAVPWRRRGGRLADPRRCAVRHVRHVVLPVGVRSHQFHVLIVYYL